jgi:hypothetical protein
MILQGCEVAIEGSSNERLRGYHPALELGDQNWRQSQRERPREVLSLASAAAAFLWSEGLVAASHWPADPISAPRSQSAVTGAAQGAGAGAREPVGSHAPREALDGPCPRTILPHPRRPPLKVQEACLRGEEL